MENLVNNYPETKGLIDLTNLNLPQEVISDFKNVSDDNKYLIAQTFIPYIEQVSELKEKALNLMVTDVEQVELMEDCKKARLAIRDVRTSSDKERKELKEESNKYNKAVQSFFNYIKAECEPVEEYLLSQEKFKENILFEQRTEELGDLIDYINPKTKLGEISDEEFDDIKELAFIKKKREEELEAERLEQAEKDRIEAQRLREENAKLVKQNQEAVTNAFKVTGTTDEQILKELKIKLSRVELPNLKGKDAKAKINALREAINNL